MNTILVILSVIVASVIAVIVMYSGFKTEGSSEGVKHPVEPKPKDISEPINLILKAMEERPETFLLFSRVRGTTKEILIDRKTHFKVWKITHYRRYFFGCNAGFNLTNDEILALEEAAKNLHNQCEEVRKQEKIRKEKENREKWTQKYQEV